MTKISAAIVADSICNGHRITTMKVTFPRMILAEAKTHRVMKCTDEGLEVYDIPGIGFNDDEMLSRNSASSRAIPFNKMVEAVMNDPFIPIAWQRDHKGMQGTEYFTSGINDLIDNHLRARDAAVERATEAHERGVTKQICNRYLEPFMWHTVLVTATELENFFHLRCPIYELPGAEGYTFRSWKDLCKHFDQSGLNEETPLLTRLQLNKGQAEIHMMALAEAMWDARNVSTPVNLNPGDWHMPFIRDEIGRPPLTDNEYLKLAVTYAARTSYTVVGEEGKPRDYKKDIELHDRLLASGHMSPFEHCAQAMTTQEIGQYFKGVLNINVDMNSQTATLSGDSDGFGWSHNLRGWKSYRSMIPNENRR